MTDLQSPAYRHWLRDLKIQVHRAQLSAAQRVNTGLIVLYWQLGRSILGKQREEGWGAKVVAELSKDLRAEFPEMKGFSVRNLNYMRSFAEAYPDEQIVQQLVAQIPWGHNVRLLDKVSDPGERLWYAQKTLEHGWSRNVLAMQIERKLVEAQGAALSNFSATLPSAESDLAQALLKDPYTFDFLGLSDEAQEREVEEALARHIRDFLLELGVGFAFVGRQYRLDVGGDEFFVDLLFYHLELRCCVVIELKAGKFKPEYAGQMNFYLTAVDETVKRAEDGASIGLILCRDKNAVVVEYSLKGQVKPMGVAEYQLTQALPVELKGKLPSVEALEQELAEGEEA